MSYKILYNDEIIYDPFSDEIVLDPKLTAETNAAHYFDFTISPKHNLYEKIKERDGIVSVYSDKKKLFSGYISEIKDDFDGYKDVTCVGVLDYLGDTLVRPYSTIKGEQDLTAPSSFDGYFQWLIDQHNKHVLDSRKRFKIGVNQAGLLDKNNYIYRSSTQLPTTASEIENKILDYGGYLSVRYENTTNILDFYADAHESNTQIIDFGVNLIDFKRTSSTDKQYTAVRPMGATPESTSSGKQEKPITIASLPDGGTSYSDITKWGDVVYSISGVQRYGYREYSYSNTDITTQSYLLDSACIQLQKLLSPSLTLDIQAVDMALFVDGFDHLDIGQAVRVRSKPHNIDEYLMVTSIDLDLQDPGNTEYTLGVTYDTLTGQQSAYLKSLNSGINSALDSVEKIDQTAKDAAKNADEALNASSKSIIKTDEEYYNSVSPTELSGGEWQNKNVWEDSKYVWNRSLITYGDNTTKYSPSETGICISGNTGDQGVPGEKGTDGKTSYFHIKYSSVENPTSSSQMTETPSTYIGTYVDYTEQDSSDPLKYTWSRFQGLQGPKGEQGIPGIGTDGKMLYATSSTESNVGDKIAILSSGEIVLTDGLTVSVTFTNGNTAVSPTLNINSTGAKPIYTNGVRFAYWTSEATVVFVYSSGNWYSASTPVYANIATIGNPASKNVYIDSDSVNIREGSITNSSFTNNEISLGIGNDSSKISMLKDGLVISTDSYDYSGITKKRSDINSDSQIRMFTGKTGSHGSCFSSITTTSDDDASDKLSEISLYTVSANSPALTEQASISVYSNINDADTFFSSESGITLNGKTIRINDSVLADFITTQDSKNGWYYRIWKSGRIEGWMSFNHNTGNYIWWNNNSYIKYGSNEVPSKNLPVTLKSLTYIDAHVACNTYSGLWLTNSEGSWTTSKSGNYWICCSAGTAGSEDTVTIYLHFVGTV